MRGLIVKLIPRFLKSLLKGFRLPLIWLFFRIRQSYPIWFYILNRRARKLFRQNPPALKEEQQRIVRDLKQTGIAITHVDQLFSREDLLPVLVAHVEKMRDKAKVQSGKTFLNYLWDRVPVLDVTNPFVRLSLRDEVLDIVNSYLNMYSRFFALTLNITRVVSGGTPPSISQKWHRDPEDKRMLKLFIYLTDVDEVSGPFTYIPYTKYGLQWAEVFPQRPPIGFYPLDGAVETVLPPEAVKTCTGRAGTVIFCDTTGLHKGGYATEKERVMYTGGYFSSASPWRTDFRQPADLATALRSHGLEEKAWFAAQSNRHPISTKLLYWLKRQLRPLSVYLPFEFLTGYEFFLDVAISAI